MDSSRVLIAVVLSLALIFAYQELVLKRLYPPPSDTAGSPLPSGRPSTGPSIASSEVPSAAKPPVVSLPVGSLAPAANPPPIRAITVETDQYVAQITTRGGRVKSLRLKHFNETASPGSGWYEMVPQTGEAVLPLGVLIERGKELQNDAALDYASDSPDRIEIAANDSAKLVLQATTAEGTKVTKTLVFGGDSYAFTMDVAVLGERKPEAIGLALSQGLNPHAGYYDIPELQADVQDKVITEAEKALRKGVEPVTGAITYAGFGDRYFLTAYLTASPNTGTLTMSYVGDQAVARLVFGGADRISTRVYMGPKQLEALEAVEPALHKAIDFGWLGLLAIVFLRTLKLFHHIAPNYGWDIILLTIALRILSLPMSIKSQRSMMKMQRLAPQLERLKEKFKDDQQRLQRETMDLYKRNHVNPLGGCLPMLVQLPIFIGLYEALLNAIELRHAPFIWWIKDLSAPDCLDISWMPQLPYMHCHGIPVLVLAMGLSTFLQQWMSPTSPDPNQQRMMMLTPIIFTIMFVNFPAGLSLYYFATNVLSVAQQIFLNREFKTYSPVTA